MITTGNNNQGSSVVVQKFVAVVIRKDNLDNSVKATMAQGKGISFSRAVALVIGKGEGKRAEIKAYIQAQAGNRRTLATAFLSECHNNGLVLDKTSITKDGRGATMRLRAIPQTAVKSERYSAADITAKLGADALAKLKA